MSSNGESWLMDPATRDYSQDGGAPVITRSLKMPMYFRTLAPRKRWLYAPDDNWGSDFHLLHTKNGPNAGPAAQAIERRALQPLIEDGRALDVSVGVSQQRGGLVVDARAIEANGTETELTGLRPLGG